MKLLDLISKFNTKEILIIKKEYYPYRDKIHPFLFLVSIGIVLLYALFVVPLSFIIDLLLTETTFQVMIVLVIISISAFIVFSFSISYKTATVKMIVKDGTECYNIDDSDEDYFSIDDAMLCAEGGPTFEEEEE